MVDSKSHARIRYERVNADTGEEVPWDRLVRGYEYEDGRFILLSDEELESVRPGLTKTIEISQFVSLDDIDPILFDKPYYLQPEKRGRKAYLLLHEALKKTGKAGISKVVIRTREYLSALFAREEILLLMLLRFPQEIIQPDSLTKEDPGEKSIQPAKKEMDLAVRLIEDMEQKWDPKAFHDEYRSALMDYIEKKVAGGEAVEDVVTAGEDEEKSANVVNLADYLQRSLKKSGQAKEPARKAKSPASKSHGKRASRAKRSAKKKSSKRKEPAAKARRGA